MRVLHVAHYYKPHIGGVERHLSGLAEELQKEAIETVILTRKHEKTVPELEQFSEALVVRIKKNGLGCRHR